MIDNVTFIAEVKTKSPFGYESKESWEELFEIANQHGDIISIHTDERWGGSFDLIRKARKLTSKEILAKGIHSTDEEIKMAVDAGADYVLVVGRIPDVHRDKCIIEPESLSQLRKIPSEFKVVWNTRDLSNGLLKEETFEEARKIREGWLCQASNIRNLKDIKDGANAILVGTHLINFCKDLN